MKVLIIYHFHALEMDVFFERENFSLKVWNTIKGKRNQSSLNNRNASEKGKMVFYEKSGLFKFMKMETNKLMNY